MNNGSLEPTNYICRVVSLKSRCWTDGSQMISHATIYSKSEGCGEKVTCGTYFSFLWEPCTFLWVYKGSQKCKSRWSGTVELLMFGYSKLAKLHLEVPVALV